MKSSLKGYKMIATKSIFAWTKVGVLGIVFSLVCFGISIWLLVRNNIPEHSGLKFYQVFPDKPWATLLLFGSIICFILYIVLANKYALQTLIKLVWENKLADFIIPKTHEYIQKLTEKQPDWMKGITGSRFVGMCLDVINQDGTLNKVQRLVLHYGFKGMKLSKSDFEDPQYQLPHIVVGKIEKKMAQLMNPSLMLFWILLAIHLLILILALILT